MYSRKLKTFWKYWLGLKSTDKIFVAFLILMPAYIVFQFFVILITSGPGPNSSSSSFSDENVMREYLASAKYEIVSQEDYSIPSADRLVFKVLLSNNPVQKDHIKAVSKKIVDDYRHRADAISMLFYFEKSQTDGAYTLAMADWAPYGDWSRANLKRNYRFDYTFKPIVGEIRVNEPTPLEREINKAMRDLWYEMMETADSVTDREVAEILASQYEKSVEEMLEIRMRVSSYDMGF